MQIRPVQVLAVFALQQDSPCLSTLWFCEAQWQTHTKATVDRTIPEDVWHFLYNWYCKQHRFLACKNNRGQMPLGMDLKWLEALALLKPRSCLSEGIQTLITPNASGSRQGWQSIQWFDHRFLRFQNRPYLRTRLDEIAPPWLRFAFPCYCASDTIRYVLACLVWSRKLKHRPSVLH